MTMAECGHCGAHVSRQFVRVFSGNDGELAGCPECLTGAEIRDGHATPSAAVDDPLTGR